MDYELLKDTIKDLPSFRQKQIYKAIFNEFVADWSEVTTLSKDLRKSLAEKCPIGIKADKIASVGKSAQKATFDLGDDLVEAVLMRHQDRNTVCVSSQAGCALGCKFCATGSMGFRRNLKWWEIANQVLYFAQELKKEGSRVTNVVFMGMGEPLLNYEEVLKAVRKLNDEEGINIGARRISISTVGVVPGIQKLAKEHLQINLAVSLHAPNNEIRDKLMPINDKYELKELLQAINDYIKETKRKVMIEYLMLDKVNDSPQEASGLAELLQKELGGLFVVNLIKYNNTGKYRSSAKENISQFKNILKQNKIEVVERYRFGQDIKAACGQLAS